jgi:hypothetical protein
LIERRINSFSIRRGRTYPPWICYPNILGSF